ncbi:Anaphase-promoting complex subunit 1 [Ascosphaera aggregata]|nr:Anaphase-promoting complex subunit 1 [Ascosphaera aggregata]
MAAVRSLGLHEPVALDWLVRESKLDKNAIEGHDYVRKTFRVADDLDYANARKGGFEAEEEIFFTKTCVVWSRGGIVMRSWTFDVEKEDIVDALFATFKKPRKGKGVAGKSILISHRQSTLGNSVPSPEVRTDNTDSNTSSSSSSHNSNVNDNRNSHNLLERMREEDVDAEEARAMVVVLKTQAHVFFLAGDSHIVPIPFEVDTVWATPKGVLFQRKVAETRPATPQTTQTKSHALREYRPATRSWVMSTPGSAAATSSSLIQKWPWKEHADSMIPRIFTLVDPGLDMGVVAGHTSSLPLTGKVDKDFGVLDVNEELIYISQENESPWKDLDDQQLLFAITYNDITTQFTAWFGQYRKREPALINGDAKKKKSTSHSKRRSSHFDLATGASTPVARQSNLRESMFSQSRVSNSDDLKNDDDDFATQLSQEFADIGLPSKASRRVSSLMARTDLAATHDRTSFSEFAGASQSSFTPINGRGRRGESFGGRSSFGVKRRSSIFPGNASAYSNSSSWFATPVDRFLGSLNGGSDFRGSEGTELQETVSGLSKELLLNKIASFPCGVSPTETASNLPRLKRYKIFPIMNSQRASHCVKETIPLTFCIMDRATNGLILLSLVVGRKKYAKSKTTYRKNQSKAYGSEANVIVQMTEASHASNVLDCCKVSDGAISRLLTMTRTIDGRGDMTLQAPWGNLFKVEIPSPLDRINSYSIEGSTISGGAPEQIELRSNFSLLSLEHVSNRGRVDIVDGDNRKHRLQIQLEPRNRLVRDVIEACQFALQDDDKAGDGGFD